jgi:hypothetical protein
VSRNSNLLIMLVNMGFDPAIRRFESFHPSHIFLGPFLRIPGCNNQLVLRGPSIRCAHRSTNAFEWRG